MSLSNSKPRSTWSQEEDSKLMSLMQTFANNKWCVISQNMGTRSAIQCMNRWTKILKPGLLKGYWSKEEDDKLLEWISSHGPKKWSECSKFLLKRSAKQCRERWLNHLDPMIKKDDWTEEEDRQIYELYKKYGTSWSKVSKEMKGRTENSIKNRFYSTIRSLIANETLNESFCKKEKKKINKNQGFFNVLKEKVDEETKESIESIKRKMMANCTIKDPLIKKKKSPNDFYENLYGKNFSEKIEEVIVPLIKSEEPPKTAPYDMQSLQENINNANFPSYNEIWLQNMTALEEAFGRQLGEIDINNMWAEMRDNMLKQNLEVLKAMFFNNSMINY